MYTNRTNRPSSEPVEVHTREQRVTLSVREAYEALARAACQKISLDYEDSHVSTATHVVQRPDGYGDTETQFLVVITEDLSSPTISDEAPMDPAAYRLSRPDPSLQKIKEALIPMNPYPPMNFAIVNTRARTITEPPAGLSSTENLMFRVNKIRDLLQGGKYNITISREEANTLIEYINDSQLMGAARKATAAEQKQYDQINDTYTKSKTGLNTPVPLGKAMTDGFRSTMGVPPLFMKTTGDDQ